MKDKVTAKMVLEMVKAQGYRCALSGRELTPESASLDHKVAMSEGGTHVIGNLWVVDAKINTAKGTMTVDEFVAMCCEVASLHGTKAITA